MRVDREKRLRGLTVLGLIAAACLGLARPAEAATLKVGVPATEAFSFMAVDFANQLGLFKKNGVEVEKVTLLGSAKLHQAMIADAIDIAVGAGSDFMIAWTCSRLFTLKAGRP